MISLITTLKNRAHLLPYGLMGVMDQEWLGTAKENINLIVGDGGSEDNLDKVLEKFSLFFSSVTKYIIDRDNSFYKHRFNCPALEYNFLVFSSPNGIIIKIDPEFVFITKTFIDNALRELEKDSLKFIMPLPHHVYDFEYKNLKDIRDKYLENKYDTHIGPETISLNVYYGCMFNRKAYMDLGGIDMRFLNGIGSEDDHFLDRWKLTYGDYKVITLRNDHGVHLWHGEWGKSVPREFKSWVEKNAKLRSDLAEINPNNGNFASINYPNGIYRVVWVNGERVEEGYEHISTRNKLL